MAFKVLTQEQIDLLTEEEKTRYEKQLKLYREREAFVKQMEAYEKMELPQVRPTLKPIPVISLEEAPEIHVPEIAVNAPQLSANIQVPKLPEYVAPMMSVNGIPVINTTIGEIPDIHIENPQLTRTKVFVPAVPKYQFVARTLDPISVPDPIQVHLPEMKPFKMEIPEVQVSASEPVQIQIPEISAYEPPQIVPPELDSVELPKIDGERISAKMKEAVQVQKPAMISIPAVEAPKIKAFHAELNALPQVSVPTPTITELQTPEVPVVQTPVLHSLPKRTDIPDLRMPEVPAVQTPVLQNLPNLTELPEIRVSETVALQNPTISVPELSEIPEIQIDLPPVQTVPPVEIVKPEIPKLSFEKSNLLETPKVDIPPVSERLAAIAASVQAVKEAASMSVELPKIQVDRVKVDEAELAEILKLVQRKE